MELTCISPVDGSVFATRPVQSAASIADRADAARAHQRAWAARDLAERVALVRAGAAALGAMGDETVVELAHMMGRPTRFGGEFGGVAERTDYMGNIAEEGLAPLVIENSAKFERRIAREPHGLVFVIAPWNYPYLTAINTIVPALIAGNAVFLKPASQTLLTGERLVAAFTSAGIPPEVFQVVYPDHPATEALLAAKTFDFVNFTGSVAAGRRIERAAAGTFTPMGLELGGKDPGYVAADANLDAAVATLIDAAMYNAGQCCCGIERIYVAAPLYDAFLEAAVAEAGRLRLGNPFDAETTLGPMANVRFAAHVRAQTEAALAAGARAHLPKAAADDGGAYLGPQILTGVTHDMDVMREESFGPVVGIMKVADDAEAIALMNDSPYGLTASIWTGDADRAAAIGAQIATGTVFMNRADYLDPALCWTGCKDTGRGGGLGLIGYQNLTRPKSYHLKKDLS